MSTSWEGPPAMMQIFKNMFGSFSVAHIIKQNDFSHLQNYFLQCSIPVAMAGLRQCADPHHLIPILYFPRIQSNREKHEFSIEAVR